MAGANKNPWILLAAVCALVIGVYAYVAQSGSLELLSPNPADAYYNLLVRGFRDGQLSLKKEVPPGLTQLANPYDPTASSPWRLMPYRLHDLTYYKGRLYLYYGITPALILFWPYTALTGRYLFHRQAVAIFCTIGFLVGVGLLFALWRRYFPKVSVVVAAACTLALGLATGVPVLLSQADIYQVPISCGYMLTMLVLGAIWRALHNPERRCRWLAGASVIYGLAVGARPSLLFGAVLLLVPILAALKPGEISPGSAKSMGVAAFVRLFLCAFGPISLIGLGLLFYNYQRFGNALEFGQHYQLTGDFHTLRGRHFSLDFLWFNLRLYFWQSVGWSRQFPFVRKMALPPLPPGHDSVEDPFGVLANIPLVWLALAVPLTWRSRSKGDASTLRWFVAAIATFFTISALTLGLYYFTCVRYEVEFLPELLLLAVMGILGSEYTLADRPAWRRTARWIWSLLLAFSAIFNLLASVEYHAEAHHIRGVELFQAGNVSEAIKQYEEALRLQPDYARAHFNLGTVLERVGREAEALEQYKQALRLQPDYAGARLALEQAIRTDEEIKKDQEALQIKPDDAEVHNNLGATLAQAGRVQGAIAHFEEAVRIQPDYAEAHYNLAVALENSGKIPEATQHYQQALRLKPDLTEARAALHRLQVNQ